MGMPRMFFITGRGRSGTWLLQSILDSHPALCVAPEALFIINLQSSYGHVTHWTDKLKQQFYEDLILEKKINDWWKLTNEQLKAHIFAQDAAMDYAAMVKSIYLLYNRENDQKELQLIGDKNPEHTLFMEPLIKLYPEAKFIHMVRDPRANILSYQNVKFDLDNTSALSYRWNLYNKAALKSISNYPDKILLIKFEDLLMDKEAVIKSICDFLGIASFENTDTFHTKSKTILAWNESIAKPIDKSKAKDWVERIGAKDRNLVESITHELAQNFGYEMTKSGSKFNWGLFKGWYVSLLEKYFFKIPYRLRMKILNTYRYQKGVLEK